VQYDRAQFGQTEHFLSIYAQHLTSVLASCRELEQHPWAWIAKPLSFSEEEEVLRCLEEFLVVIKEATDKCQLLDETAGIPLARGLKGLESAGYGLSLLPEPGGVLIEDLLFSSQSIPNRQAIVAFIDQVELFRSGVARLSESASDVNALLDASTAGRLTAALSFVSKWAIDGHSVARTREVLRAAVETTTLLEEARSSFQVLLTTIGCETEANLSTAALLLGTLALVENAPFELFYLRQPTFESENTCLLYTSPSPRDLSTSRMPSSA